METPGAIIFWATVGVQLVGLASAVLARSAERAAMQRVAQTAFLVCLLLVGAVSMLTIQAGGGSWLFLAATLPVMTLGATLDLRRGHSRAAF